VPDENNTAEVDPTLTPEQIQAQSDEDAAAVLAEEMNPSSRTTVVNIRHAKCDVYIGRPRPGQDGYFGNKYHVEPHGREVAISMFRSLFARRLKTDHEYRLRVLGLRGKILGCYCKPLSCHGDVIADWVNSQEVVKP